MTYLFENQNPAVQQNGFNTAKDVSLSGTTTISGTITLSGTTTVSGNVSFTGSTAGVKRSVTSGSDATYTLTTAQSGTVFIATKSSSTQTYTLPSAATAGVVYTFICGHASGEILITPAASQTITVTSFSAVGASPSTAIVAPAAGTGIKNTAATNAVGDSITLVSDGGTGWYGIGISSGIWASQ